MDERAILLAATRLDNFRASTLCAYSGASEADVLHVLDDHPEMFQPIPASRHAHDSGNPRWQVAAPQRLADYLSRLPSAPEREKPSAEEVHTDESDLPILLIKQAQHYLVTLSAEPDVAAKRVKVETARNFLAQSASLLQGEEAGSVDWQRTAPDRDRLPARLRLTLTLAELTLAQLDKVEGWNRNLDILGLVDNLIKYAQDVGEPDDHKLFELLGQQLHELNEVHLLDVSKETINITDEPNIPHQRRS